LASSKADSPRRPPRKGPQGAQGQSDKEISENPEIKSIIANLPRQSRNKGAQRVKREAG
jgi:hypothetical protein